MKLKLKRIWVKKKLSKSSLEKIDIKNETGGSVVEYALLLGFSIFIFLVIVGIILSIAEWVDSNMQQFFTGF